MAKGEYVFYLGDDDRLLPGALARFYRFLKRKRADIAYVPYISIEKGGKIRKMEEDGDIFSNDLVMRPHTFAGSIAMRRKLFTRLPRKLVEKGLETIHVHSWVIRLNGLYYPQTTLAISKEPLVINGSSNITPPLSWELIVHSKVFAKMYTNLILLPKISVKHRMKFVFALFASIARAFFFIWCERVFRPKQEKLPLPFFTREYGIALGDERAGIIRDLVLFG